MSWEEKKRLLPWLFDGSDPKTGETYGIYVRPKSKRDGTFQYTISARMFCGPRTFAAKKVNRNKKIDIMNQKAIMKERSVTYDSTSDQETIQLGQKLGEALKRGDIIALVGELGSGKTWFTKGLALGSGVSPDTIVTSPSFALINEYEGRYTFFHMDVYRLETLSDFLAAGLDEYFYQDGIVAMEWANRWPEVLPEWRVKVEFVILNSSSRRVILSGYHPRAIEIIKTVQQELN